MYLPSRAAGSYCLEPQLVGLRRHLYHIVSCATMPGLDFVRKYLEHRHFCAILSRKSRCCGPEEQRTAASLATHWILSVVPAQSTVLIR